MKIKSLLLSALGLTSSFAAITAFDFNQYDFTTGGVQDFVVGNHNGNDCIISVEVFAGAAGANGLTHTGNTGDVITDVFSVSSNFNTTFGINFASIFERNDGVRSEEAQVTSSDGVSFTALAVGESSQAAAGTGVPTFTAVTDGYNFSIVQPTDGTAASTTHGGADGVNFSVTGSEFTASYASNWGSAAEVISFTFDPATHIPEPSSAALLGLGGLALIARRRR